MGKNTRTIFKAFDYLHCDDFAKFLMDMAAQGWHFKEWGVGLKFEKGEPEHTVYAVEVFTDASEYDLRPEPNTEEFAEYCKVAGWELVDAKRKFCIFKRVREDATPILTQEERVQNVIKESKGTVDIPFLIASMLFMNHISDYFAKDIYSFTGQLFSPIALAFTLLLGTLFIGCIVNLIGWSYNKRKMKQKLAAGEVVYIGEEGGTRNRFVNCSKAIVIFGAIAGFGVLTTELMLQLAVFLGGTIAVIGLTSILLAKFRPDSATNYIVQMVVGFFYFVVIFVVAISWELEDNKTLVTDAPIKKADYVEYEPETEKIFCFANNNILGSMQIYVLAYAYVDEKNGNGLIYEIYSSEIDWIMDHIWKMETGKIAESEKLDCTKAWGAETAFLTGNEKYFVRYEDTIITFTDYDGTILTQEQIDIICEKLDVR